MGRRSVFNDLRKMVTSLISLRYMDSNVVNAVGNSICVLDYYVDDVKCIGNCVRISKDIEQVELMGHLINAVINVLGGELTKIGIDYGTERVGVVLVYDNAPLIGNVLTHVKLIKLLRLINGKLSSAAVGDSPTVHEFLKEDLKELCSVANRILIVDELESSRLRNWISTNGLASDVADAYAITLTRPKAVIKCS